MPSLYNVSAEAQDDLFAIWSRIGRLNETEFHELFTSLGKMPGQGHTRKDLTDRPVRLFSLYSFLVVYEPDVHPIRMAV